MARRCTFLFLAFLLASAPVFACLPSAAMTDAELACCKKMAGNCEMGTDNHSCCKNTANRPQSLATISQSFQLDFTAVYVTFEASFFEAKLTSFSEGFHVRHSFVPISPPAGHSTLRI